MTINIVSIETTASNIFHAALTRAGTLVAGIQKAADAITGFVDKVAPLATTVLSIVAPTDAAAVTVVKTLVDTLDAAIDAAGASASGGVTLTLPAELVADYNAVKAALIKFESTI